MNRVLALQKLTLTSPQAGFGQASFNETLFEETLLISSASGICQPTGLVTAS